MRSSRHKALMVSLIMIFSSLAGCLDMGSDESEDEAKSDGKTENYGTIMVSTYHIGELVSAVVGDAATIEVMSPSNVPVHDYEPSAADLIRLQQSDIFFYHGLNLEPWVVSTLASLDDAPTSVEVHAMPSGQLALGYESMMVEELCELLSEGPYEESTLSSYENGSGLEIHAEHATHRLSFPVDDDDDHDDHDDHGHHDHDEHDDHDDHGHDDNDHEDDGNMTPELFMEAFDTDNDSKISWDEFWNAWVSEEDDHDDHDDHDHNETDDDHDDHDDHDHNETEEDHDHDHNETEEDHENEMSILMNIFNESDADGDQLLNLTELETLFHELEELEEGHDDHDHGDHDDHDDHEGHDDHDDHDHGDHDGHEGHDDHDDHDHGDHDGHDDHDDHDEHAHATPEKVIENASGCSTNIEIMIFHLDEGEYVLEFEAENMTALDMSVLKMGGAHHHHDHGEHGNESSEDNGESDDEDGHEDHNHDGHDNHWSPNSCHDTETHETHHEYTNKEDCEAAGHMWMEEEVHDDHDDHNESEDNHSVGFATIHIEETGEYGFAVPKDVEFFVLMDEDSHSGHDHGSHDGSEEDENEIDAGEDEEAFEYDPHSWLDPLAYKAQLDVVLTSLISAFPSGESEFKSNAEAYASQLDDLDAGFEEAFGQSGTCTQRTVVANHNAYAYIGKRYNIQFISVHGLDPEGEPSAEDIADVVEQIEEKGLTVLFVEEYTDQTAVDSIVEETGVSIKILYTMEMPPKNSEDDYLSLMNKNLENLKTGMNC